MGEILGRFHPLIVHLPIGILSIAFLIALVSNNRKHKELSRALPFILKVAILSSVVACLTGWAMPKAGEFDEELIGLHFWMAIAMTVSCIIVYLLFVTKNKKTNRLFLPFFWITMILLTLTGHYGGSLTHGARHLLAPLDDGEKTMVSEVNELVAFEDVIRPILKQKCFSCHNNGKRKGGLTMSTIEGMQAGGDKGLLIYAGNARRSPLLKRVHLALDDKEHMPPEGKKQLTESEILLMEWWIDSGASYEEKVKDIEKSDKINDVLQGYVKPPGTELTKVDHIDDKILDNLQAAGIGITRENEKSHFLIVNLSRDTTLSKAKLKKLNKIASNILELDLSHTNVSNDMMPTLKKLKNLRKLKLNGTDINSQGIKHLISLKHLQSLNLYKTQVDDESLHSLRKIKSLKTLHIWQSKISEKAIQRFSTDYPLLDIQNGVDLTSFGEAQLKPPLIQTEEDVFEDTMSVHLETNFKKAKIFYTLDGSTPDSTSLEYLKPISINKTTVVKTISFKEGWTTSTPAVKVLTKLGHKISAVNLSVTPGPKYKAEGSATLIDGKLGSSSFSDGSWLGFEGQHLQAIIDLGTVKEVHNVVVGALEDTGSYIFFPRSIKIESSSNGSNYKEIGSIKIQLTQEPTPAYFKSFLVPLESTQARYLKISFEASLKNPAWHPAPGAKNWLFLDEIMVD